MKRRDAEQRASLIERACLVLFAFGLLFTFAHCLASCAAAPKPCPVALEADYTAELVSACRAADAGSLAACEDAGIVAPIRAKHQAEQKDAGCRYGE